MLLKLFLVYVHFQRDNHWKLRNILGESQINSDKRTSSRICSTRGIYREFSGKPEVKLCQINDTLYHIIDDHVCFWRGFQFCLRKKGGITFLANTCSTHRESCAEDRLFFKLENSAHSLSSSCGAQSWHVKLWKANKLWSTSQMVK